MYYCVINDRDISRFFSIRIRDKSNNHSWHQDNNILTLAGFSSICRQLIYFEAMGTFADDEVQILTFDCAYPNIIADSSLSRRRVKSLQWRLIGRDSVSNHQPHDCLLNRLFRRRSKKTSKLRVTGLCVGNSPGTGEFPALMASNAENVSIWWRHHVTRLYCLITWLHL